MLFRSDIAKDLGLIAVSNVVILSIYFLVSDIMDIKTLNDTIPVSIKKKNFVDINLKAVNAGIKFYNENLK